MIVSQRPKPFRSAFTDVEDAVTISVEGYGAFGVQLLGTWAGTVTFEASINGTDYVALNMVPSNSATPASTSTANGSWTANVAGFTSARARFSADTSGTVECYVQAVSVSGRF
jgi:hypothetical protein